MNPKINKIEAILCHIHETTRNVVSSGRPVATLESADSFLVVGSGNHGALGSPVSGPFSTDDK